MQINDFSDLSDFIFNEYSKINENFGVCQASENMIKFIEKKLKKYAKLYDKPLYKKAKHEFFNSYKQMKLEITIRAAIDSMPHSRVWRLFHHNLWQIVKYRLSNLEKEDNCSSNETPSFLPEIVKPVSMPPFEDKN